MYSKEDFNFDSFDDILEILIMAPFIGLCMPFILAAYTVGGVQDLLGWLDT